jgi:hypothetical protein
VTSATLVWIRSEGDRRAFTVPPSGATVGRGEEADIVLDEAMVSRQHARIERRGSHWTVRDLGSTNLTKVNGVVVGECVLDHADEVCFSRARCVFELVPCAKGAAAGCEASSSEAS